MGSNKIFFLLGLSLAIVLLIISEVAARDLAETQTTTTNKNTESAGVEGYHGGGGYHHGSGYHHGGGHHGGGGGCHQWCGGSCCADAESSVTVEGYQNGDGHHGGGGGGGHGCHHGWCGHKCCNYAGEVVDAETTGLKPQN